MVKKRKLEGAIGAVSLHEWDKSLAQGDLVFLAADGLVPHVYVVREYYQRIIMDHELFNNPSLLARGVKSGDEIVPTLVIRRVREAPYYTELPMRHTLERQVDASKVVKITEDVIRLIGTSLQAMHAYISSRNIVTTEKTEP